MSVITMIRRAARGGRLHRDETGGIVSSWLIQLTLIMGIIAIVGYEAITVGVTALNLDDSAREVALEARDVYRSTKDLQRTTDEAESAAEVVGVNLVGVEVDGDDVVVSVSASADTLFIHRISVLDNVTNPTAVGRARWRP